MPLVGYSHSFHNMGDLFTKYLPNKQIVETEGTDMRQP